MSIGEPETAQPETQEPVSAAQQDSRRRGRSWVLGAGCAVVAAALAAGLTVALHKTPAPSPLSAVTSALARTSARSFTFSLNTTTRTAKEELNSDLVSGTIDPSRRLGTELLTTRTGKGPERAQIRFSGAYEYTSVTPSSGFGKLWDKTTLAAAMSAALPPGDPYDFVSDRPLSPTELDVVLQSATAVVHDSGPVSGRGWTGTRYTFTAGLNNGLATVSGTVDVDQQGRVRQMTTTSQDRGQAGGKVFVSTIRKMTFSAFGDPVEVTTPPASQVKATSGKPYWGFYF